MWLARPPKVGGLFCEPHRLELLDYLVKRAAEEAQRRPSMAEETIPPE